MRKFATKFISRQNSVNQYFVFCLAYFVFCLAYLVFWLENLVFVWCTWCLVYVVFCLAYIIYFWRTWCIFWRNWCLWHWDVVFLTFLNWDGASNIFITKNVQIYVFIPWINFPKSSSYRVLCGKRYASLKKVHHPRLWGLWQLSGVRGDDFHFYWSSPLSPELAWIGLNCRSPNSSSYTFPICWSVVELEIMVALKILVDLALHKIALSPSPISEVHALTQWLRVAMHF